MKLQNTIFFVTLLLAPCALKAADKAADDAVSYISSASSLSSHGSVYDLKPSQYDLPECPREDRCNTNNCIQIVFIQKGMPGQMHAWVPAPELPFNTKSKTYRVFAYKAIDGTVFKISEEVKRVTYLPKNRSELLKGIPYKK